MLNSIYPAENIFSKIQNVGDQRNWRIVLYLSLYRVFVAIFLSLSNFPNTYSRAFGQDYSQIFFYSSFTYVFFSLAIIQFGFWRWPRFNLQMNSQMIVDITALTLMTFASGGVSSGLGLLMVAPLLASVLVSEARMVMLYTAIATSGVLIVQMFSILTGNEGQFGISTAGILGFVFFLTTGGGILLVNRARKGEALAAERAADLRNMALINQLVIDDLPDGIIVLDEQGVIRQTNQLVIDLLPACELDTSCLLANRSAELARDWEQWRMDPTLDCSSLVLGKAQRLYQPKFVVVHHPSFVGAVLQLRDMTREREEAQQIKLAALGRLTANMAHEIRNPLAAISYAAELLSEGLEAPQARLMQIILNNTHRINHLIHDVMMLNRRDRRNSELINLSHFLFEFISEFSHVHHLSGGELAWQCSPVVSLCFDREHLRQVLTNLCLNAIKHSQKKTGSVQLIAQSVAGVVSIDCKDDGVGVLSDSVGNLFEPFFTTDIAGTGLGLYISRELCQANGASLEYVPAATGAHFKVNGGRSRCHDGG